MVLLEVVVVIEVDVDFFLDIDARPRTK